MSKAPSWKRRAGLQDKTRRERAVEVNGKQPPRTAEATSKEKEEAGEQPRGARQMKLTLTAIAILSLFITVYLGRPVAETRGLGPALVWGIGAGVSIWVFFYISYRVNKWLRRPSP